MDIYSTGSETLAFVIDEFFVVDSFFPLIMVVASKWPCLWLGLECIFKEFSKFFLKMTSSGVPKSVKVPRKSCFLPILHYQFFVIYYTETDITSFIWIIYYVAMTLVI